MCVINNKKIIFVNPPLTLKNRYGQLGQAGGNEPPLGLCYLASVIRKEGYEVRIIDAQASGFNIDETIKLIKSFKPNYLGITASTMAIKSASELAYIVKLFDSNVKIIIGGCHVSSLPVETLKEYKFFDVGVVGEGEDTIRELIFALDNKVDLSYIKGIVRREDRDIYLTPPRPRIKNLDSLSYPAFDLLPDIRRFYRLPTQSLVDKHSFSLVTSRGCFGKCTFCDNRVFGNYTSIHSAEYIVEMISILNKNHKITNILFEDDNFMISKQRLKKFVDLINKENLKIRWSALARVDSIDRELLEIAKEGRCWQVSYGIESGCQRILDFYKKGIRIKQIRNAVELTKKIGLKIKGFFIWGNPTEDKNTIKETINFIRSLKIDDVAITFFTPYPGSEVWANIKDYGYLEKNWEKMTCYELVFIPHSLEETYLINTRKQVLKDFYFRPKIMFSYISRIRSITQLKDLILSGCCLFSYVISRKKQQKVKYLIVNADDFGLTKGINRGIIKAFKEGIVKSTSIMALGKAFDNAVVLAKENPDLDIGIHLCLSEEKLILSKKDTQNLIGKDGNFLKSHTDFIISYILGKIKLENIEKELDVQIRKVLEIGIRPSHIDSHGYIHMLPQILKIVMKLAKRYQIPFIRWPYEQTMLLKGKLLRQVIRFGINMLCLFSKQSFKKSGSFKVKHFYGFLNSGHLSVESLKKFFETLHSGVAEVVCHPGICDEETKCYSLWGYAWEEELITLTSMDIKKLIKERNINLVSFRDIL